jgi:hypothetical protein
MLDMKHPKCLQLYWAAAFFFFVTEWYLFKNENKLYLFFLNSGAIYLNNKMQATLSYQG